jgi:hypothetical protein
MLSTVSGGSIIGAYYYLKLKELLEGRRDRSGLIVQTCQQAYIDIVKEIENEFLKGVQTNIRMQVLLDPLKNAKMLLSDAYSRSDRMSELYDQHFYQKFAKRLRIKNIKLTDLKITPVGYPIGFDVDEYNKNPATAYKIPILTINATSLNTGHRWCFTSSWVGECPSNPSIDTNVNLRLLQLGGTYSH